MRGSALRVGEGDGVRVLSTLVERMRGLMFADPATASSVMLVPCADIHTYGMSAEIDVAFFDAHGRALAVYRRVGPCRRIRCRHARFVIERFADEKPWFAVGQSCFSDVAMAVGPAVT
jgi:uncharacterized membrane protein (UPF0127 family)